MFVFMGSLNFFLDLHSKNNSPTHCWLPLQCHSNLDDQPGHEAPAQGPGCCPSRRPVCCGSRMLGQSLLWRNGRCPSVSTCGGLKFVCLQLLLRTVPWLHAALSDWRGSKASSRLVGLIQTLATSSHAWDPAWNLESKDIISSWVHHGNGDMSLVSILKNLGVLKLFGMLWGVKV